MLKSPNFKEYPTTDDLPIEPEMKLFVKGMLKKAEEILAGGDLIPVFFIRVQGALGSIASGEAKVAIIMSEFAGKTMREVEARKDATADQIRTFARKESADAIMMFSEAWTIPQDDIKEYYANQHKYPNGMGDHPRRKAILSTSLELFGRQYMAVTEIVDRKIGAVSWVDPGYENIEGRFVKLLPQAFKPFAQPPNAH